MSIKADWAAALKFTPHGDLFKEVVQALHDASSLDGLTHQEIAAKCGCSAQTISNWMNYNTFTPHLRTVAGVCRGLKLNLRIDKYGVTKLKAA